jgi:hypothetical protein
VQLIVSPSETFGTGNLKKALARMTALTEICFTVAYARCDIEDHPGFC